LTQNYKKLLVPPEKKSLLGRREGAGLLSRVCFCWQNFDFLCLSKGCDAGFCGGSGFFGRKYKDKRKGGLKW
jgi:hypothetical protein